MDKRAAAFSAYGEAAILDLLVKVLPYVVGQAAAPIAGVDKMTVISSDGAGALSKSVASNVAAGMQLSKDLTGVDLAALLSRIAEKKSDGAGQDGDDPKPGSQQITIS